MMISPISSVPFRGVSTVSVADKATDAISTIADVQERSTILKETMDKDKVAYSDAISNLASNIQSATGSKGSKITENKMFQKFANALGGFAAFCTGATSAATAVTATKDFIA